MIALADIAQIDSGDVVNLSDLSKRQNLSLHYLEQLYYIPGTIIHSKQQTGLQNLVVKHD